MTDDYDPWDPWPSTAEQVAMTLRTPPGMEQLCDCGVPTGESEATNPDDRAQTVQTAVNTAYGTDPRHHLLAQHVAAAVLDGTPLPWSLAKHFGMTRLAASQPLTREEHPMTLHTVTTYQVTCDGRLATACDAAHPDRPHTCPETVALPPGYVATTLGAPAVAHRRHRAHTPPLLPHPPRPGPSAALRLHRQQRLRPLPPLPGRPGRDPRPPQTTCPA